MPHRNAPLTETGRLRPARCVVEDGWPLRRAAERFQDLSHHRSAVGRPLPRVRRGRNGGPLRTPVPQSSADPTRTERKGGDRLAGGVGGEAGQAHPVGVGEAQLGAGVRPFLPHDQPQPLRPASQAVGGEFGHRGAVVDIAVGFHGRRPDRGRYLQDGLVDAVGDGHTDRVRQPPPRRASQATNSWVPPPESIRISVCRPRRNRFGRCP